MVDPETYSKSLTPYIPRTILNWYRNSSADEVHVITSHEGCVVCIDASGFTALTRQLSSVGKEGPEILTKVLNLFFEAVSNVIFRYDGDVLKFAGDALWAYFPERPVLGNFFAAVLDAVKTVNTSPLLKDRTELSVHLGAEAGQFYLTSLGDRGIRLEAEPLGNLLATVYGACDAAGDNEFAIGPALAQQVTDTEVLSPIDAKFWQVKPASADQRSDEHNGRSDETTSLNNIEILRSYIPQDVLAKIETSAPSMSVQGEHRHVVVLFASFENNVSRKTDDPVAAVKILNDKLLRGFETIRDVHGSIARIDPFKRGHKLLVLFGAPTKRENDEINALQCARKLLELNDDTFRIRIGLAIGPLFCGDVGAEKRREYTVMGDGINLAARLMAKASWNEIIIGPQLRPRLPAEVTTEPVTLSLKGIGKDVICHRFTGVAESARARRESTIIVGQQREQSHLASVWEKALKGERQFVVLSGSTGVGKSTLLHNFISQNDDIDCVNLECKNSQLFGGGWLTQKLLDHLIQRHPVLSGQSVREFVEKTVEERWLPLLADVIQRDIGENQWTRGLTPELRNEKTSELFDKMIRALVISARLVILDDFDMSDEVFRRLILTLSTGGADIPLMLVIVTRDKNSVQIPPGASVENLELVNPPEDKWWQYFDEHFQSGKREQELFEKVLSASDGNPHFIMQFQSQCVSEGKLIKNAVSGKWELADSGLQISVPDGLVGLHLSVFDGLPEVERTVMKTASVAVGEFSASLISRSIAEMEEDSIARLLNKLADADLLRYHPDNNRFSFVHTSMREAVYRTIPASQLRVLHKRFAEVVEQKKSDEHSALLAYHFHRAGDAEKGFRYSLAAARQALDRHALTESAELFNQCLEIMRNVGGQDLTAPQKIGFYEDYVRFLNLEGRFGETYSLLRQWRRLARSERLTGPSLMAAIQTASVLWSQSRYFRSQKILNKVLEAADSERDKKARAKALSILCQVERRTGDFGKAQQLGRDAVKIAEEIDDPKILAEATIRLGLAYWVGGKLDQAADMYRKVADMDGDDKRRSALALNNLAVIEQDRGNFINAEKLTKEALEIVRSLGDRRNEGYASGNLANISKIFGKLTRAEELYLHADLIFERLDDRHAHFYSVGNLGDIDLMRGEMSSAEQRFKVVAAFAEEVDDKELIAECYVRFGELAFFARDISDAEANYQKAIDIAEEVGSHEYLTRACVGLARLLIGERNHDEALKVIERISQLAADNNAILPENEAIFLTGEHHRIRNELPQAVRCYRQALTYARDQYLFELTLKLAVRLYETEPSSREESSRIMHELKAYFVEQNSLPAWDQLVSSAYFSYFADTLKEVAGFSQLCASPSVLD